MPDPNLLLTLLTLLALLGVLALRHRILETVLHSPGSATLGRVLETRGGDTKAPKKRRDSRNRTKPSRWVERNRARAFAPSARVELPDAMKHVQILAGTGGGKTTLLVHMALQNLRDGLGVFIIETGGDFSRKLEPYARALGVAIYVFDPSNPHTWKWNPLEGDPERAAERCASAIVAVGQNNQQFFSNINSNMLRATVLGACAHAQATGTVATLATVRQLVNDEDFRRRALQIEKASSGSIVRNPYLTPSAREFWTNFENSWGQRERSEFVTGLKGSLEAILQRETVKAAICPTGEAGEKLLPMKEALDSGALVIFRMPLGSVGAKTARDLSVWVMQIFQSLVYERGTDAPPLIAYMDEIHNTLGKHQEAAAEEFSHFVTMARHYNVGCVFSYQGMDMLSHDLKVVLATNCRTKLFSGGQSPDDSDYIQRYMGDDLQMRERSRVKRSNAPGEEAVATVEEAYDRFSSEEINALPLGQWLLYSTANGQVMYPTVVQTYEPPSAESVGRGARLRRLMGTR